MTRRRLFLSLLVTGALTAAFAKPNFSGNWKRNASKSDFGPAPGPSSMTREIKHDEPNLELKTTQVGQQGESTTEAKYTTDGKETINKTPRGDLKGAMKWDGDVLAWDYKVENPQAGQITISDRWTLSEDGKTTTVKTKITGGFGEFERTLVLEKQ